MARKNRHYQKNVYQDIKNAKENESKFNIVDASGNIASREASIDYYSLFNQLPNPDPILKKLGISIKIYDELRYDSRVSAVIGSRKAAVLNQRWEIVNDKDDFFQNIFSKYKMHNVIGQILNAPLYGYQVMEIIWQKEGNNLIPIEFIGKPQRWFRFDTENRLRFLTKADQTNGVLLPDNKFVVATSDASYDNPYGYAVLSAVFWPVSFRKGGFKWWTIFVEKYGMPFIKAVAPSGTKQAEIEDLADKLADMVQDAIAIVPEGYTVDIVEASKSSSSDAYKTYIDQANTEIAIAVLGSNLTTEIQGGSFAASKSSMEVRFDITDGDTRVVEDAFNELIKITYKVNFGIAPEYPRFNLYVEDSVTTEQTSRDKALSELGLVFTSKYIERTYNLNSDDYTFKTPIPTGGEETKPPLEITKDE